MGKRGGFDVTAEFCPTKIAVCLSVCECVCLLAQSAVAAAAAFELPQRTRLVAYGRVA